MLSISSIFALSKVDPYSSFKILLNKLKEKWLNIDQEKSCMMKSNEEKKIDRRALLSGIAGAVGGLIVSAAVGWFAKPVTQIVKTVTATTTLEKTVTVERTATATPVIKPTTLNFWYAATEVGSPEYLDEFILPEFYKKYPQITVVHSYYGSSYEAYETALKAALSAGSGPDVFNTPGPTFTMDYIKAGWLLPIDEYISMFNWDKKWRKFALRVHEGPDGKIYGCSGVFEGMVLYINKPVFKKEGWSPPKTYAELLELCEKAKKKGYIPIVMGYSDWPPGWEHQYSAALEAAAGHDKVYEALTHKRSFDDKSFVDAIAMFKEDLWDNEYINHDAFTIGYVDFCSRLSQQKAAMTIMGTWVSATRELVSPPYDVDVMQIPPWKKGVKATIAAGVGDSFVINAKCKNPEAAMAFWDFYTGPEVAAWAMRRGINQFIPRNDITIPEDA
ncbi:hypothetical protein DRO64_07815, partial [Candidatus Bathyarchaeota archaeon]